MEGNNERVPQGKWWAPLDSDCMDGIVVTRERMLGSDDEGRAQSFKLGSGMMDVWRDGTSGSCMRLAFRCSWNYRALM